jgi:hypothetical protein
MKQSILMLALVLTGFVLHAQKSDSLSQVYDSLFIKKFEKEKEGPLKLLHAEPLYIDLIRDLGARKGEREWNFGLGMTDNLKYDEYEALVEYEWAMFNRLGFEVELPFTFFYNNNGGNSADSAFKSPGSRLNSLKLASQWTFLVNEKAKTSLALGYLHEFLLPPFRDYGDTRWLTGHLFEPFVIAAKRWGSNFHTLLYTGPVFEQDIIANKWNNGFQAHLSFHYMLPGTRNFIGVENNSYKYGNDFDMTIRPQMRLGITDNLLIGIVVGIPVKRENQRMSTFLRLIYEPAEHNKKHLNHREILAGSRRNQGLKKMPG